MSSQIFKLTSFVLDCRLSLPAIRGTNKSVACSWQRLLHKGVHYSLETRREPTYSFVKCRVDFVVAEAYAHASWREYNYFALPETIGVRMNFVLLSSNMSLKLALCIVRKKIVSPTLLVKCKSCLPICLWKETGMFQLTKFGATYLRRSHGGLNISTLNNRPVDAEEEILRQLFF